ncbi:erythroblast membrane-associated protein [Cricetulus griseus]
MLLFLSPPHPQAISSVSFSPFGLCHAGDADKYYHVPLGGTAELSCPLLLWPGMVLSEVRWQHLPHTQAVHVLRDGQDSDEDLMPEYKGRTKLVRDTHKGSYTLHISNVRLEDRGLYQCQFRVGNQSQEGNVTLQVAVLGSDPFIHVKSYDAGWIQLVCQSMGWFPKPWTEWRDTEGRVLQSLTEAHSLDETALFQTAVSSRVRDNAVGNVSCTVRNEVLGQEKTTIMVIGVVVTLDPDTAHPKLILSEDRRCVRLGDKKRPVPDNPQRFDFVVSVLGSESFTTGCHYWEVYVGEKTKWILGVCSESVSRKGKVTASPANGHWLVRQSRRNEYEALTSPQTSFRLKESPKCVGVFLDYEAGVISFYNVTDKSHIFTFTHSFSSPLRPFFEPCLHDEGRNTAPLIICTELQKSDESIVTKQEGKSQANGDVSLTVNPSLLSPQGSKLFPVNDTWPSNLGPALQGFKAPSL